MKTLTVAFVIAVTSASPATGPWPAWIERLGWTLVHSVWQLGALALVMWLVDVCARRASPRRRYLIATATLGSMLVLPAATWLLWTPRSVTSSPSAATPEPTARQSSPSPVSEAGVYDPHTKRPDFGAPPIASYPTPLPATDESSEFESPSESDVVVGARREVERMDSQSVERRPVVEASEVTAATWIDQFQAGIEARLEWLVWFWLAGVALFSCRPVCGILGEWRLRRIGRSPVEDSVDAVLRQLARRMGMTRTISIAQSALVRVPLVIGYLRPLILLPVGALAGLTSAQLEAILAHELAHIRRHDWLVNALQVLAETVLFFHPAVWWVSRRVRQSRELCCDDLALELVPDRAVFARALLILEEFRLRGPALSTSITLAATGGQLSERIRRLLPAPVGAEPVSRSWWAGAVLLIALGLTGGVSLLARPPAQPVQAEESEDVADADEDSEVEPGNTATYSDPNDSKLIDADTGKPLLRVVTVVDEDGQPVPGASVRFQFRVTKQHLSIVLNPVKTNPEGVACSEIPADADSVGISVNAAGFGEGSADEFVTGKSRIVLKRGRVILVRPVDRQGRFLKHAVPLLAGSRTWGREFTFKKPDLYESPPVDRERKYLRVACSQADGPMLFSDPVDVTRDQPGPDRVFELTLTPGVRLTGRLDDSVPRPIQEGYVELAIVAGEDGTLRGGELWEWNDFTPVRPDGTFTFESLPAGCHAQLHVLVDGYMSKNPPVPERLVYLQEHRLVDDKRLQEIKEYVDAYDFWPQFVALDRPQVEVTIPCEPTAACEFLLLDPAGAPVPNAAVSFNPNGVFVSGGLFIPGTEDSTALLVDGLRTDHYADQFLGKDDPTPHGQEAARRRSWAERSFIEPTSDASGRVRIRNLPGGRQESFQVHAPGFVLPVSPLLDDQELARGKSDDGDDDEFGRNRFGLVDLQAGKTIEKTIYLERKQATVNRELIVVNRDGSPVEQVSLAVVELSTGENQWQTWSQQRFGPTPRGKTDRLGRLILRLPSDIDGKNVERVRLGVNYFRNESRSVEEEEQDPNKDLFISRAIVEVTLTPDEGLIVLLSNSDKPADGGTRAGFVRYGRLAELLPGKSPAELLQAMARQPNLAILRVLLAAAKIRHPQPVELLDDSGMPRPGPKSTGGVQVVSVGEEQFTIVEARVRPLVAPFSDRDGLNSLPECAYVFDQQGTLLAALGGEWGRTGSNSPDHIEVLNLGPLEDWFVRVSRFEQNKSFDYLTEYYRVGNPVTPALRLFHLSHSGGWSIGPDEVKRYGELSFHSPDVRDERRHQELATLANGAKAVSGFLWDGNRNRFIGPPTSLINGRPIYEVDIEWSKDFESLVPGANQLVVTGGEYEYGYIWNMAVPDGTEVLVKLAVPQASGPAKVFEHKLKPGRQGLQLYFKPDEDQKDKAAFQIELRIDDPEQEQKFAKFEYPLPDEPGDDPPASPPVIQILNPQQTACLLEQPLESVDGSVVLEITPIRQKPGAEK